MNKLFTTIAVTLSLTGAAAASTLTETFDFVGGSQGEALRSIGWNGGNAADSFISNPEGPTANDGGEGAVSVGNGSDGAQGFAFWSQKRIGADGFLYTSGAPFRTTEDTSMSWFQRDSGTDPMHVALLVDTTWYVSNQTFNNPDGNTWVEQTFNFDGSTFFEREMSGTTLPGGGLGTGTSLLAAGSDVQSWGFWFDGPKSANTRVDTITVSDVAPIPLPAAGWMLIAGIGGLAAMRRRAKADA